MQATYRLVGDTLEDFGEPGLWIEVVELGRSDQRVHGRGTPAAAVRAAKQPRFSAQGDTAQRPFGRVVRETDPPVVEESREGWPAFEHVVHDFGDLGMAREPRSFVAQPFLQRLDQRCHLLAPIGEAQLGRLTVDRALMLEDAIDPAHRLERQGSRDAARPRQVGKLEEASPSMGPAQRLGEGPPARVAA